MKPSTHVEEIPLWNIILDLLLICIFLSVTPFFEDHVRPFKRGFFCDDASIRYPYKSGTIHDPELYAVTVLIPLICMTSAEWWRGRGERRGERRSALVAGWAVPAWVARWARHVLLFAFGLGAEELLTNVGKNTVGRLRPHFLAVCQPSVQCNASALEPHAYITDYECTAASGFASYQSRLSFPSGHSSVAFYGAIFTVLYLEKRIHWPKNLIVYKTAFEVLVVATAWFCALSRIHDYKHHWGDVLAGSILGGSVAWFWVVRVLRVTVEKDEENSAVISETNTFVFPQEPNTPEEKL